MKKFRLFFSIFLVASLLAGLVWSLQPILHARAATIIVSGTDDTIGGNDLSVRSF